MQPIQAQGRETAASRIILPEKRIFTTYEDLPHSTQHKIIRRMITTLYHIIQILYIYADNNTYKVDSTRTRDFLRNERFLYNIITFNFMMKNDIISQYILGCVFSDTEAVFSIVKDAVFKKDVYTSIYLRNVFIHLLAANNYKCLFNPSLIQRLYSYDLYVTLLYAELYNRTDCIDFIHTIQTERRSINQSLSSSSSSNYFF